MLFYIRLNDLATIAIHHEDVNISPNEVLDKLQGENLIYNLCAILSIKLLSAYVFYQLIDL